jgi:serine/threonine-protein kinase
MLPIVSAIGSAHSVGIVHRDLKPENVFLHAVADGEVHARVLDFGIAKLSAPEGAAAATAHLTSTGAVMGTPYYMAPEQVFGEKDLDHRADVWAVGVMSYECLAGNKPFDGDNVGQLFKAIVTGTLVPLEVTAPHLPKDVTDAIGRLLKLDRNERAPDLRELYEILKRYSTVDASSFGSARAIPPPRPIESGALTPLTPPTTVSKTFAVTGLPLEKRRWVPIGAVLVVVAVGTVAWVFASSQRPEAELGEQPTPAASLEPELSPAPAPTAVVVEPAPTSTLDAGPSVSKTTQKPAPHHVGTRPSATPSAAPAPSPPQPTRVPGTPVEEVPF